MGTKVLFVHEGYLYRDEQGNIYGAQYNDALVNRYACLGDQVTFILREKRVDCCEIGNMDQLRNPNLQFIPIPNFKSIIGLLKHQKAVRKSICAAVKSHDVIVARMPSQAAGIAIKEAKRLNKPLLVEMVACTFDAYWNHSWKGKLLAHYRYYVVKRIIRDSPYVIYVTQKFLQERYPTKGIQMGVSDVELPILDKKVLERRLYKIKDKAANKPMVVGTVAALAVAYKCQADVIWAISSLKKRGMIFHYHLVGEGDPSVLQQLINNAQLQNEVKILGTIKHEEVFEFLDGIDLYIQPSKQEGLPRALVEAMSRACPAIGSNRAGIPELLEHSCLFDAGDIKGIMLKLVNIDREFLLKQAVINFQTAKAYEKDKLNKTRIRFYNRFLKETQRLR